MSGSDTKQSQEETILQLLAANHSLQREIAALREAVRLAEPRMDWCKEWRSNLAVLRALEEER